MHGEPQTKRVAAFFDGQSLFYAARYVFGYRHPNYDVFALASLICKQKGWELVQTRFYTGVPSAERHPSSLTAWNHHFDEMRSQGVHVFATELKYETLSVPLPDGSETTKYIGREKGVDVRIALDVIKLGYRKEYDIALIFSQDQDLVQVADDVKELGRTQDRWINVACAFPWSPEALNKRGIDRTDWIQIDRASYEKCLRTPIRTTTSSIRSEDKEQAEKFLSELETNCGWGVLQSVNELLWMRYDTIMEFQWPNNTGRDKLVCLVQHQKHRFPLLMISTTGFICIPINNRSNKVIFPGKNQKVAFLKKLNENPIVSVSEVAFKTDPLIPISDLTDQDALDSFCGAIDWLIEIIKNTNIPGE